VNHCVQNGTALLFKTKDACCMQNYEEFRKHISMYACQKVMNSMKTQPTDNSHLCISFECVFFIPFERRG
jgi:hypothetical protein